MRLRLWARSAVLASLSSSRPVYSFTTIPRHSTHGHHGRNLKVVAVVSSPHHLSRRSSSSSSCTVMVMANHCNFIRGRHVLSTPEALLSSTRGRHLSAAASGGGGGGGEGEISLTHIGREEMEEILEDVEHGGREESGYVVLDVRNSDELAMTGTLGKNTFHLPLPLILEKNNVFTLDDDEFLEVCGFEKPHLDETLVFSCAAGKRSVYAAQFAGLAGYSKLVNYMGGANEWFRQ